VAGGRINAALGFSSTVGGGGGNTNSGVWATIAGGRDNLIGSNAFYGTIGGGVANQTGTNNEATVAGGAFNHATGFSSTISGGGGNLADGAWSTVGGGRDNAALGDYSHAAGRRAKALNAGAFVWADSSDADFSSAVSDEFAVRAAGGARFVTSGAGVIVDGRTVLTGSTGPGSGFNADLLDGLDSTSFALSSHNHFGEAWTGAGDTGLSVASFSAGANAAGLVGRIGAVSPGSSSTGVLGVNSGGAVGSAGVAGSHSGSGRGVSGESVNGYGVYARSQNSHAVYAAGSVSADRLAYNSPRTHYLGVPGDLFVPRTLNSTVSYLSVFGNGGAYMTTGTEVRMRAPLNLPDGAVITSLRVYFFDNSTQDLTVSIVNYVPGGYGSVATVDSSGIAGNGNKSVVVSGPSNVIHNNDTFYMLWATSSGTWSTEAANLRIVGVTVGYTVSEAD